MNRFPLLAAAAAMALTAFSGSAHADEDPQVPPPPPMDMTSLNASSVPGIVREWPKFGAETEVNFEYDHLSSKGAPAGSALNVQAGQQFLVEFDKHFSISNLWTLQPLDEIEPGRDRVLRHHALFVEELFARWNNQAVNIKVGKFAQNFARGWYVVPGLYGQDIVGDYGISETLGIEAQFDLGFPSRGLHQLSISAFELDRSPLSDSLFTRRGPLHLADGGAANTKAPKSFAVSYDATNVPVFANGALNYQLSAARLAHGSDGDAAEQRYAASADINLPLNGGTIAQTLRGRFNEFRLFGEAVRVDNENGFKGHRADYQTVSAELASGPWVFDTSVTLRQHLSAGLPTVNDDLESAAIGYNLPSDTVVALGIAREHIDGSTGTYVGISISQVLTTCDRCLIRARHY